jgi:hypothetical protein
LRCELEHAVRRAVRREQVEKRLRREGLGTEDAGARPRPDREQLEGDGGLSAVCHTTAWCPYSRIDHSLSTTWYR